MSVPKIEVVSIESAATFDPNNINKHTVRGHSRVENSLRRRGANRSVASAGKGVDTPVLTAGNLTYEKAIDAGFREVVNVYVDGSQLVNVVRMDVEPGSAEAVALGIEDNAAQDFNPDTDILAALAAGDTALLKALRDEDKVFDSMVDGMGLGDVPIPSEQTEPGGGTKYLVEIKVNSDTSFEAIKDVLKKWSELPGVTIDIS